MTSLRHSLGRRFGTSLAGLALGVQLVVAGWGLAFLAPADPGDPLAEHALCLAGDDGRATPSRPSQPAPAHVHDGLCCVWHVLPALQPNTAAAPQPVAYAEIAPAIVAGDAFVSGPHHRPANARAPPTLA